VQRPLTDGLPCTGKSQVCYPKAMIAQKKVRLKQAELVDPRTVEQIPP